MGAVQRVGRIIGDSFYRYCLEQNAVREVDRPFCRHDFQHMLDVARISYILMVEGDQLSDFTRQNH
ncbi:MAG: phosphohydrolase, partial [Desulfofundulus sp.]